MADPRQLPSWAQGILPPDSPFRTEPPAPIAPPRQAAQPPLQPPAQEPDYGYGFRYNSRDPKGLGYLGTLRRPDGTGVMGEYSIDEGQGEIPSMVPTLTREEVDQILALPEGAPPSGPIRQKASAYAQERRAAGQPVFARAGEQQTGLYPDIPRDTPTPRPQAPPMAVSHEPALKPPRQTSQPPLAVSHAPQPPPSPWTKAATIGAPVMGEQYSFPGLGQILASDQPLKLAAEYITGVFGGGRGRPRSLANADPIGVDTFTAGKGPPPMMLASIHEVGGGGPLTAAARGLYSRVDDIAAQVPAKGMHPNTLAGLLKSGASQEEVAYRQLPEFLASSKARVMPQDLRAHLDAHPAPFPETTVLGEPGVRNGYEAFVAQMEQKYGEGYDHALLTPEERTEQAQLWEGYARGGRTRDRVPKHSGYVLPGGEAYREHLYTLPSKPPPPPSDELQALYNYRQRLEQDMAEAATANRTIDPPAAMQAHYEDVIGRIAEVRAREQAAAPGGYYPSNRHFDQPDLLAHARTTERTLPVEGMRSLPEIEQIIQDVVGAKRPEHIASGGPGMAVRQGLITHDEAALYGQSKGFTNYPHAPTGPRGRFIEEVQSDWHQEGKERGYRDPHPPSQENFVTWLARTQPDLDPAAVQRTAQELFGTEHPVFQAYRRDQAAVLKAQTGVPDAPFKESWPALVLKQQLLDAARDPNTHWLGLSSPETQIKRWGSERVRWKPSRVTTGEWDVTFEPQVGGDALLAEHGIADMGAEAEARGHTHTDTSRVRSEADLAALMGDPQKAAKAWKRIQASPGQGEYLPRAEGFRQQYGENYKNTLAKLMKSHGGTVEPFDLSTVPVPSRPHDPEYMRGFNEVLDRTATEPGVLARLTPEIRASILKKGFPLMMLPLAVAAASHATGPGADVGTPPPVPGPTPRR